MEKVIIYKEQEIIDLVNALNTLHVCGISNCRTISKISDIIDFGKPGYYNDEEGDTINGVESKKICTD